MHGNPCCLTGRRAEKCSWINRVPNSWRSWRKWHRLTGMPDQQWGGDYGASRRSRGSKSFPVLWRFCWITRARSFRCRQLQLAPWQRVSTRAPYVKNSASERVFKCTNINSSVWATQRCIFLPLQLMRGFLMASSLGSVKPHCGPTPYGKSSQTYWIQLSSRLKLEWEIINSESLGNFSYGKEVVSFAFP